MALDQRRRKLLVAAILSLCFGALEVRGTEPLPEASMRLPDNLEENPDLRAWFDLWRGAVPDLNSRSFRADSSRPVVTQNSNRYTLPKVTDIRKNLGCAVAFSPGRSYALGWHAESQEPESMAYQVDLETREVVEVLYCGSACDLQLATWLNERRFVIAGTFRQHKGNQFLGYRLTVYLFNLEANVVTQFGGPLVNSPVEMEPFREKWHRWLIKSFSVDGCLH